MIISPAKQMTADPDSLPWRQLPTFLPRTRQLVAALQALSYPQQKRLWHCSDALAEKSAAQLARFSFEKGLTPALLAFCGLQYRYMAPGVFTQDQLDYLEDHLRILSGLYGLLRPLDGISPCRLEMAAPLACAGAQDLYGFWGDAPARALAAETDLILDLASAEYSRCVAPHLPAGTRRVRCVFGQPVSGRVVEKGTLCKMARGEMVRFLAEQQAETLEQVCRFDRLGYRFCETLSQESTLVFLKAE